MEYPLRVSKSNLETVCEQITKHINFGQISVAEGDTEDFWTNNKEIAIPLERRGRTVEFSCEISQVCTEGKPGLILNLGKDDTAIPVGSEINKEGDTLIIKTNCSGNEYYFAIESIVKNSIEVS